MILIFDGEKIKSGMIKIGGNGFLRTQSNFFYIPPPQANPIILLSSINRSSLIFIDNVTTKIRLISLVCKSKAIEN